MVSYKLKLIGSFILCLLLVLCESATVNTNEKGKNENDENKCDLPQNVIDDIAAYSNVTEQIINYFTEGEFQGETWRHLADFIDKFGHRITGSQNLEEAIDYMVQLSQDNGLKVHTEDVEVNHWIRGEESATILEPRYKVLPILGLGGSAGTQSHGITAKALVVQSFDELHAIPNEIIEGKIIVFAQQFTNYSETVKYRLNGASEAAKRGAVAVLLRSITPFSMITLHTGIVIYYENVTKIPVAAITHEDADQLLRMQTRGSNVTIKLTMPATSVDKISRNTIADLVGTENSEKKVIVSGHIDSWDVGEGAMDDAAGCFISWVAPVVLKKLKLHPRRTIRTILWTGEEQGFVGAYAYEKLHREDDENLHFVMESDYGTFTPQGLTYAGSKVGECIMREILKLFHSINATRLFLDHPGPDIRMWTDKGIPGGGLLNANELYFWYHHSEADRLNIIKTEVLDKSAAFWTAFSYIVADLAHDIPRRLDKE